MSPEPSANDVRVILTPRNGMPEYRTRLMFKLGPYDGPLDKAIA